MVDPVFQRARLAPLQPKVEPVSTIDPTTPDETPGIFKSMGAAFGSVNFIAGGARALAEPTTPEPVEGFNAGKHMRDNLEAYGFLLPFIDDTDSGEFEALSLAQSPGEFDLVSEQIKANQQRLADAWSNGAFPAILGMLGGVILDLPTAAGVGLLRAPMAGYKVGTAARAAGAARVAAVGGGETALAEWAQSLTDPALGVGDIALATAIGAGAGGVLGGLFPHAVGNIRRMDRGADTLSDDLVETVLDPDVIEDAVRSARAGVAPGGTVGAAAAPVTLPAPGSAPLTSFGKINLLRSPKSRVLEIASRFRDKWQAMGLTGGGRAFDIFNRLVRFETVNLAEVGGGARREMSAQMFSELLENDGAERTIVAAREYSAMLKDAFGLNSFVQRTIAARGSSLLPKRAVTKEDFGAMADELAQARVDGLDWKVWDHVRQTLTDAQHEKLVKHLTSTADADDAFFLKWGKLEVETGLLKAEDLKKGYRPQLWNREEIIADPDGFEDFLLKHFMATPSDEFLLNRGYVNAGQTYDDLRKADPAAADEALDDFVSAHRERLVDARENRLKALERQLKAERGKGARVAMDKLEAERKALLDTVDRQRYAQGQAATEAGNVRWERAIAKTERDLAAAERRLADAQVKLTTIEGLDALIKAGARKSFQRVSKLTERVERAEGLVEQGETAELMTDLVRRIRQDISTGRNPIGFLSDDLVAPTGRLKRRTLRLGATKFTEGARKFQLRNSQDAREAYVRDLSPRVALRKIFGNDFDPKDIRAQLESAYVDDLRRTGLSDKDRAKLIQERIDVVNLFDGLLKEFTGKFALEQPPAVRQLESLISKVNATTMLGGIVLAMIGDLAVMLQGGGRALTGFRQLWRAPEMLRIARELGEAGEESVEILALGANAQMGTRYRSLADTAAVDVPGGWMRSIMKKTDNVSMIQAYASGMNTINQAMRGSFGIDFMRQIGEDVRVWGSLSAHLKTFYARHGIDGEMAGRIAARLDEDFVEVKGFKFPKESAWAEKDPGAWDAWRQAVHGAGEEVLIDPSLGDQVFLRHYPMGRLVMQFQGFAYSAMFKFYRPLVQEMRLHPTSIRPYFAVFMALTMGTVSDFAKAAARGDTEEWLESWETMEGTRDRLFSAWVRSPLAIGPAPMLSEVAANTFGRPLNDMLEAMGGARVIPQAATKFREQNTLTPLLGPTAGQAQKVMTLSRGALESFTDADAFAKFRTNLSRRTPILNTFYLQGAMRLLEGD